jgi:translation initiation factor IF-3
VDRGRRILDRLRGELAEVGVVETEPRKEGSMMHMIIAPKKGASPSPAVAEATKGQA